MGYKKSGDLSVSSQLTCSARLQLTMSNQSFSNKTYSPGSGEKPKSLPSNDKSKEKDQMVGLNDKFVQLIDKVKNLENEKKKLNKKLELLKGQVDYAANIEDIVRQKENELEQKIYDLVREQEKLKDDLVKVQDEVEDSKKKYEDEVNKRSELERDFIIAKKNVDEGHTQLVTDALELDELNRELDFLREGFDEEIRELESMIKNDKVVLHDDNKRSLDLGEIVKNAEAQYANMAARAREEAEQWNQRKMNDLVSSVGQREQEVRDIKREISDLLRLISKLKGDLDILKKKEDGLKKEIDDIRNDGEDAVERARKDIRAQEEALQEHKKKLAQMIKDHQELLNLKLAFDIEIATYRKLLEGEENRLQGFPVGNRLQGFPVGRDVHLLERKHPQKKPAAPATLVPATNLIPVATVTPTTTITPVPKKRLLIRLEVESGRVVSESSHYTD